MKKKLALFSLLMILFGTAVWAQLVPTLPAKDLGFDSICFEAAIQDVCLSSDGSGNLTINDVGIGALPGFVFSTTGTLNRITASPTTGAVVVDIASTYIGQTSITTLGTITTGVWNGTSIADGFLDSSYLFADGTRGLSGNWDAGSFKITALQFESDIITGTAPLIVASTTLVANLNADLLDGIQGEFYQPRGTTFGSFEEFFNALVTSDGATVTLSIEKSGSGDLTMVFSDGLTTLDTTPADTIALTAGSDTSPTENYIYIPQSTKVLTKSTSDWPSAQHIKVGFFLVPSAGFVQTNGVYVNQNWNDPLFDTDNQGHLTNMAERSRLLGAIYHSGIAGNGTDNYLTPTASNVELKATAGLIYQMHRHTIPVFDTSGGDIVLVKNWNGDAFHDITNLFDITKDSTGADINNNKYFNLILWAVANKTDEFTPMMINLPAGSYNTQAGAESDSSGFDDFTIPSAFKLESSTGFLIARITIRMGTTWSVIGTVDLRGSSVASATGGAASIEVEFADNAFKIFDESDVTRVFEFQASGITGGNTRTITVPDTDLTLVDDAVVLKKDGSVALTGNWDAGSFEIRSETFESDIATGTPPLTIASTTLVGNFNADLLDGIEAAEFLQRDGSIPLTANWDVGAFTITGTQFISDIAGGTAPFVVTSTTVVANLNVDQVDGKDSTDLVLVDGSQALSADWDAGSFEIRAQTFESDVATSTAPFVVASTTLVSNLNADLLDGVSIAGIAQISGTPAQFDVARWVSASAVSGGDDFTWDGSNLKVEGIINVNNATVTLNAGVVAEVNTTLLEFGINEGSGNRFGGSYTQASQGGMFRFDARANQAILQFFGRPAAEASGFGALLMKMSTDAILAFTASTGVTGFPGAGTYGAVFSDGTALSSMASNTAGIYADDDAGTTAMHFIDEADTITQGTPHRFSLFTPDPAEPFPWSYYSKNAHLGIEINVDLAKLARLVEEITGEQIIYTRSLPETEHLDWMRRQQANVVNARQVYERWEQVRDLFLPTPEQPIFTELEPPFPEVEMPPAWMLERLKAQGKWDAGAFAAEEQKLEIWKQRRIN